MKKLLIFAIILLVAGVFSTCKKETTVSFKDLPELNGGADVPDGTVSYTLSVQVIPSSDKARVSGLDGAKVTVNSAGGIVTATTGVDGIAVFSGLPGTGGVAGLASVYVDAGSGFSKVNIIVPLPASAVSDANQTTLVQTQVIMPRLGASLMGIIYGDFDGDGNTKLDENAAVNVRVSFVNTLQPNVYDTTTSGTDGSFKLINLPETGIAGITISHDDGAGGIFWMAVGGPFPALASGATSDLGPMQVPRTSATNTIKLSGRIYGNFGFDTITGCPAGGINTCVANGTCCLGPVISDQNQYNNGITIKLTYNSVVNPADASVVGDVYTTTTTVTAGSKNGYFEFTNLPVAGNVNLDVVHDKLWYSGGAGLDDIYADYNFAPAQNHNVTIVTTDDYQGPMSVAMTAITKP